MMPEERAGRLPEGGGTSPWWEQLAAHSDRDDVREEIGE
jgi:hypothetical protein